MKYSKTTMNLITLASTLWFGNALCAVSARAMPALAWEYGFQGIDDSSQMCYMDYIEVGEDPPQWCEEYMGTEFYCNSLKRINTKKCITDRIRPPFLRSKNCDEWFSEYKEECRGTEKHCEAEEIIAIYGSAKECLKLRQ